MVLYLSICEAN